MALFKLFKNKKNNNKNSINTQFENSDIQHENIDENKLYGCIDDIFNNYDDYVLKLDEKVRVLEKKAHENDIFLEKQLDFIRKKKTGG